MPSTGTLTALYRYPVKGLSAEPLAHVRLSRGESIPFDRAWAIENGPGRFDPLEPKHLPKVTFLTLMRNERLAGLCTRFDEATHVLAISRGGRQVAVGSLDEAAGRRIIEQFFAAYMQDDLRGAPRVVSAPGHSFSDVAMKCVHIINLASLRELERGSGRSIDPLRFRPNLVVDGFAPWAEFGWIGAEMVAGSARLEVVKRTDRCAATNVAPSAGVRDMDIPAQLARQVGHTDFGVYAVVASAGEIAVGDVVTAP